MQQGKWKMNNQLVNHHNDDDNQNDGYNYLHRWLGRIW